MTISRTLFALVVFLVGLTVFIGPTGPPAAQASDVHLPIVGRQFIVVGAEVRTGSVVDWSGDSLDYSPTIGPRARLGLHHILSERFSMNGEIALGASYLTAHPMAPGGNGDSRLALDWGLAVIGRYFPVATLRGLTVAGGLQYRRTSLSEGALLQLGADTRLGYRLWTSDERFMIVELGLYVPFIEGVSLPSEFIVDEDGPEPIPDQWMYPAATLGIQWAF